MRNRTVRCLHPRNLRKLIYIIGVRPRSVARVVMSCNWSQHRGVLETFPKVNHCLAIPMREGLLHGRTLRCVRIRNIAAQHEHHVPGLCCPQQVHISFITL